MKDFDINFESYDEDLFVMDSVESTSALLYKAVHAGATIFAQLGNGLIKFISDKIN